MSEPIPAKMRAVQLDRYIPNPVEAIRSLRVVSKPTPRPRRGEVLVRIEAAPCNPSDIMHLQGKYGVDKTLPSVPGWEGAGTVVASGGGLLGRWLVGKRVACGGQADADGTWAQYYITKAALCVPLKRHLSTEDGATLLVNPVCAYALLEKAKKEGHQAAMQTAAASQVGRMLVRLAAEQRFPLINVVRHLEQIELLKSIGADIVINSESENFDEALTKACQRLDATIAFEPIAGQTTGRILSAMPPKSVVVVYGRLSNKPCSAINPCDLIFENKRVEGFWLKPWVMEKSLISKARLIRRIQKLKKAGVFDSTIRMRLKLDDVVEGLVEYQNHMTKGKVLICPNLQTNSPDQK